MANAGYAHLDASTGKIPASENNLTVVSPSTFTPTVTLVGGVGNTTPVYSVNSGRYQQIGNLVFVDVNLSGDGGNEGAGTGVINIALPVAASANHQDGFFPCGVIVNSTEEQDCYGKINGAVSTVSLSMIGDTAGAVQTNVVDATGADQNSTTRQIRLKFFYEV